LATVVGALLGLLAAGTVVSLVVGHGVWHTIPTSGLIITAAIGTLAGAVTTAARLISSKTEPCGNNSNSRRPRNPWLAVVTDAKTNTTFDVDKRRYRFRLYAPGPSRWWEFALYDGKNFLPFWQISSDGNLLPQPVKLTALDEQGIAERYDIVIDFSRYPIGAKLYLVNLCEHDDGRGPEQDLRLGDAFAGRSGDPCVGKFLEFCVVREPATEDKSLVPDVLIPNPTLPKAVRERTFLFGRGGINTTFGAPSSYEKASSDWAIRTDGGEKVSADWGRVSAAPRYGTCEVWHLVNDGGGWDHPIHIHFEEGQILARNGSASRVPPWEKGRKDVYRLRPGGTVTIKMQFRDWGGMFMEHCHNTTHEDNAMLLRWELDDSGEPFLAPLPTPVPTPEGVTYPYDANDILLNAF